MSPEGKLFRWPQKHQQRRPDRLSYALYAKASCSKPSEAPPGARTREPGKGCPPKTIPLNMPRELGLVSPSKQRLQKSHFRGTHKMHQQLLVARAALKILKCSSKHFQTTEECRQLSIFHTYRGIVSEGSIQLPSTHLYPTA